MPSLLVVVLVIWIGDMMSAVFHVQLAVGFVEVELYFIVIDSPITIVVQFVQELVYFLVCKILNIICCSNWVLSDDESVVSTASFGHFGSDHTCRLQMA